MKEMKYFQRLKKWGMVTKFYSTVNLAQVFLSTGHDLGKINRVVEYLRRAKFKASRTHFDPEAIRTNCTLAEFTSLLVEFSRAQKVST